MPYIRDLTVSPPPKPPPPPVPGHITACVLLYKDPDHPHLSENKQGPAYQYMWLTQSMFPLGIGSMINDWWLEAYTRGNAGLILGLHPANERHRYFVTMSLIGWAQT